MPVNQKLLPQDLRAAKQQAWSNHVDVIKPKLPNLLQVSQQSERLRNAGRWMKHKKCSSTCWSFNSSWRGVDVTGVTSTCRAVGSCRGQCCQCCWGVDSTAVFIFVPGKFANIARIWLLQLRWASRMGIKDARGTAAPKSSCKATSTDQCYCSHLGYNSQMSGMRIYSVLCLYIYIYICIYICIYIYIHR